MQISYHSTLKKIQKLQNLKKKKKNSVPAGTPEIGQYGRYGWYLNRYETLMFLYQYTYRYGTYRSVWLISVQY